MNPLSSRLPRYQFITSTISTSSQGDTNTHVSVLHGPVVSTTNKSGIDIQQMTPGKRARGPKSAKPNRVFPLILFVGFFSCNYSVTIRTRKMTDMDFPSSLVSMRLGRGSVSQRRNARFRTREESGVVVALLLLMSWRLVVAFAHGNVIKVQLLLSS
jgi:hypothetical protein